MRCSTPDTASFGVPTYRAVVDSELSDMRPPHPKLASVLPVGQDRDQYNALGQTVPCLLIANY